MADDARDPRSPDFGPGGYLPERAAKRARKIVLREQMGLQWPIAAVVAAVLVLIAGGVFLVVGTGPPDAPFQPVIAVDDVDPRGAEVVPAAGVPAEDLQVPDQDLVVVRAGGGVRVFLAPIDADALGWCAQSGRLESADGRVWNANGRLVGGDGESLRAVPAQAFDGVLYVDPAGAGPAAPREPTAEQPVCGA